MERDPMRDQQPVGESDRPMRFIGWKQNMLFRNFYRCERCSFKWEDMWSAKCEDDCPNCGARHMTPHHSEDAGDDDHDSERQVVAQTEAFVAD
jgi:DNA-directed RNA polymerase subunit RPC12/RpoP